MDSLLRVGIIGCGLIGNKRAKVIHDDPSSHLYCAADTEFSKAKELIKEHADTKATPYKDWKDLLKRENLDAIIIATPNKYLKELALVAAQRKIHTLCEKPLGRNFYESIEMVQAAKKNHIVLKTGFNHRHHPAIFKAHQLVKDNIIGHVYYARCIYGHGGRPGYEKEWRADRELSGGGELLDQGVHVVDLCRWFMGDFEEAYGYTPTYFWDMKVEDNAFALFKTAEGQTASMHTSWTQWKNRFTFEIYGKAGYVIMDGLGGSYGTETLRIGRRRHAGGPPDEEIIEFPGPDISWEEEWREFISAIRENREPMGNGEDGLEAMRMIEAVYRSAQENRLIKISEVK